VSSYGTPTRGWKAELRLSECQDNLTLIAALSQLWASRPTGPECERPYFIGVHLNRLVPDQLHSLNLFDGSEQQQSRARLVAAMDALNNKYGLSTLTPATMLTAFKAAPTRIAFHTIPELF
jgi:DNA polymerase-4